MDLYTYLYKKAKPQTPERTTWIYEVSKMMDGIIDINDLKERGNDGYILLNFDNNYGRGSIKIRSSLDWYFLYNNVHNLDMSLEYLYVLPTLASSNL